MSEKHTPGPWSLDIGTGTIWASRGRSFDSESDLVERVATMRPTCVTDRWEADARLIAASPELLAAAKRALPYLASHVALTLDEGPGDRLAHDAIETAIAKAEGK